MKIFQNKSLKNLNTFGVNALAEYFVEINKKEDLIELFSTDTYKNNKKFVLGGGSNILLKNDVKRIVIHNKIKGINYLERELGRIKLRVGGGENWHDFIQTCVNNNLSGMENLALIPGNVGAAPVQNIGAYGVEQDERFVELEAFDLNKGEFVKYSKDQCKFSYRNSIFKNEEKGNYLITSVTYELSREFEPIAKYKDIERELDKFSFVKPDLRFIFDMVCRIRKAKLPYPDELGNAGSFFKNPVISKVQFENILEKYGDLRGFEQDNGTRKISAGWLIEKSGWKGKKLNEKSHAAVSDRHALVLVNYGNASGIELYELSERIIEDVQAKFDITLEREVNVIDND